LTLDFGVIPTLRRPDNADHRLTAGMNVDMLNRHPGRHNNGLSLQLCERRLYPGKFEGKDRTG
jgi:hypothetical protein